MRVCIISREYPPDTGFGGIATFANHLAHGLKDLGHEVIVVSLAKDIPKDVIQNGIPVYRVEAAGITANTQLISRYIPYATYALGASSALWRKFLELHKEKAFDVVDTPELLAEGLLPAITKAAPLLIRLYTPHSKFIDEQFHNINASFDHQFIAMTERLAMLSADVLTSPSHDLADFVSNDLNYPTEKIAIVPNPIDAEIFCPEGNIAIEKDDRAIVLFVGRLEERKGIRYLIQAIPKIVSEYPKVRFIIIGNDTTNGDEKSSTLKELEQFIKEHNCNDHVEFIDRIPLSELPAYYRSADISVVPSLYDNSPYTCLEAMACGRAVIGTSAGGTAEYIIDQESGLIIPPKSPDALAESILQLLKNPDHRLMLAENARQRVLANYERLNVARQTVELYKQAIETFSKRQEYKLYYKDPDKLEEDAITFLAAFDNMLFDQCYKLSYRFRLAYWSHQIRQRPKLTSARVGLKVLKNLLNLAGFGKPGRSYPSFISKYEETIRAREAAQVEAVP